MATKIRLQRHGRKGKPFYWIVAADSRAKRDGKFIEKIGTYNPNTNPAKIDLNLDSAVQWLHNGAQPTETARRLLSYKGVLFKHHLDIGVNKGALSAEQAEEKLKKWLEEKAERTGSKVNQLQKDKETSKIKRLEAEKAYRENKTNLAEKEVEKESTDEVLDIVAEVEATDTNKTEVVPEEKKADSPEKDTKQDS